MKDNKKQLEAIDDAAHMILGGKWRMPSWEEIIELYENCYWQLEYKNGSMFYRVTSRKNGNSITIPKAGKANNTFYSDTLLLWSSSTYYCPMADDIHPVYMEVIGGRNLGGTPRYDERAEGFPIRPVIDKSFSQKSLRKSFWSR